VSEPQERSGATRRRRLRLVLRGVLLTMAAVAGCYGTTGALWAADTESFVSNSSTATAWRLLAVLPWLAAGGALLWFGWRQRRWWMATKLSAVLLAIGGCSGMMATVVYALSLLPSAS
jgi:hypothetical protein